MCGPIVFSLISNSHWEVIEYCLQIKKGVKEKEAFPFFSTCLFRFTYLHTPWYLPAGQSPRGTYQSSALCVGKNPICTWCRSLYWSRTRSSLSCTLEGEAKKEGESSASLSSGADRELRGFGERGRPWRNYTVSLTKKKKEKVDNSLWFISLRSSSLYHRTCFPWHQCVFTFVFLLRSERANSVKTQQQSRWGIMSRWPLSTGWTDIQHMSAHVFN